MTGGHLGIECTQAKFKDAPTGVGGRLTFVSKFVAATSMHATIVVSRHVKTDFDPLLSESHGNVSGSTSGVVIPGRAMATSIS